MKNNESGFTLIELMVATAMVTIVVGVIYAAYNIQTKIYTEQDKTAEMQQNIRAGLYHLQREARMAGYNSQETKDSTCNKPVDSGTPSSTSPGIHTASYDEDDDELAKESRMFGFSLDLNNDNDCADTGENITYGIYKPEGGIWKLGRMVRQDDGKLSDPDAVAENIIDIDFIYLIKDSDDSNKKKQSRDPVTDGFKLDDIVAVQVSLLAEARTKDRKKNTNTSFTLPVPDWLSLGEDPVATITWTYNDSVSRRLLTTTINLRNMGL